MTTDAIERRVDPLAGRQEGDMPSEEELIAGFLSRKPAAEAAFVEEMKRHQRADIRNNFPSLMPQMRDLEQSALLKLCQMREDPREVKRICPPIAALTKFLNDAPARVLKRIKKTVSLTGMKEEEWEGSHPASQEEGLQLKRMMEIAASLPGGMAKTILAQAAHEMGDGPPLHEVLALDRRTADKRLARARIAVLRIARGETLGDETEVEDE